MKLTSEHVTRKTLVSLQERYGNFGRRDMIFASQERKGKETERSPMGDRGNVGSHQEVVFQL